MPALLQRTLRSATGWSLLTAGLRFISSLLLLPLILRSIAPAELGLWYVFVSLGALGVSLDLGFAHASTRSMAYLWAGASHLLPFGISEPGTIGARAPNLPLLASLVASLRVYYFAAGALLFVLLTSLGGAWIWQRSAGLVNAPSLRIAFAAYAFGVSLGLANSIWPSLLAGIDAVKPAQQVTAVCLLVSLGLSVAGLLAGWGIWALVAGTFAGGLVERFLGRWVFRRLVALPPGKFDFTIIHLLWPNAWRTAAVGLGAFMIVQANVLICSAFLDLRTTASYGLSLQAATLLAGMSSIWVRVKLPAINQLRAQGSSARIAEIFRWRIGYALLSFGLGALVLLSLGSEALTLLKARTQLLPAALMATLLLIQLLEMHHALYGELVYSENLNPFVKPALISGVATVIFSVLLTPRFGVWGMLLATGGVQLCFNNWWPVVRAVRGLGPAGRDYWRLS